ncbi:DUF2891 domain-containing protein [Phenylobacterium sp. SCN 70-31]|uniref:DUF2891 domain-containing protein n=1 Tax=Phenylobacterium sp. SCN 70-31 TaxID=1660129 RepID=UPI00086AB22B|nr:DUF2891 domain-containing protein [Phenylobacterium sp. SCN 70-31]ODT85865.1 MAG: hypothetical protein ABS78_18795 [Phenylobacterium sp. SCN 70-31]
MPSHPGLTADVASRFARIALGHVAREYPNKMDHVLDGRADVRGPRDLHPVYFGSFDWHSCVHGYWTLATVLRRHPDIPEAAAIRALFGDAFTPDKVAAEAAYLARPSSRGFERPYGWGWLLKLQAELLAHDAPWAATHQPLADAFAQRFRDFLPLAIFPIRTGVHSSTAFALTLAADYADAVGDAGLLPLFEARARAWYGQDRAAQAWEPSLDDFLSPTLMEAACMARLGAADDFRPWFDAFLPEVGERRPASLFAPVAPTDRTDGKIAHLDGLNLSRAWCWRTIAAALPADHPAQDVMAATAERHLAAALPHVAGDYMGEHWLASFALLALLA